MVFSFRGFGNLSKTVTEGSFTLDAAPYRHIRDAPDPIKDSSSTSTLGVGTYGQAGVSEVGAGHWKNFVGRVYKYAVF